MTERLTLPAARRIALSAQGLGARPATVGPGALGRTLDRLGLFQIDSVSVVARAHYLPAFSRLGAYDRGMLERLAWGPRRQRRMWEYWAHEASLLPLDVHPLLRWRMARADRGEGGYGGLRAFATERRGEAMALLDRVRDAGPLAASDLDGVRGPGGWWGWSDGKRALEWLFWAGHLTTAIRRNSFERVYDLPERVLPDAVLALSTPPPPDAHAALIERAARALGIADEAALRDYWRLSPGEAAPAIARLADAGVLLPAAVAGVGRWWLHRDARRPRRVAGAALLAPFDPLVWFRPRAQALFGFRYRLEIYTPAAKRVHGYYVLPFLFGDALVARVDLKADRAAGRLLAHAVHWEDGAPDEARDALRAELALMAGWLGLEKVERPSRE